MKLRTGILLAALGLLVMLSALTVALTSVLLGQRARTDLAAALDRAHDVFEDLQAYRQSLFRSESLAVAQEPRLKAVVGTEDISRLTVVDVARELQRSVNADLLLMLEPDGSLRVDTAYPEAVGASLADQPVVAAALRDGDAGAIWTQDARVFQVHAHRLGYADVVIGALILGRAYDDDVAATVRKQTGAAVVVTLDGAVIAHAVDDPAMADALARATAGDGAPHEQVVRGRRYLVRTAPLPGYTGERSLVYTVAFSLDDALATSRTLTLWIVGLAVAALAAAAALAWLLARRIARPIDQLARFTRDVAAGNLDAVASPFGPDEVQTLAGAMNDMVAQIAASRAKLVETERLQRELEIANRIQTSILPRDLRVPGLDLAARMQPASEVGGDYYDVLPAADGCWLGIGDVAGHGLTAGVVMLMVQSLVAVLVHDHPDARPVDLLPALNTMLVRNIRGRLEQDEHITFTLLRVHADGRVLFAGAHEEIVVCRAAGPCERIPTPGSWLGVVDDIDLLMPESELSLAPGDLLLLHSDGVTEAMNAAGACLGLEPICAILERERARPVAEILDLLFAAVTAWTAVQKDDVTLVLVRYLGPPAA
jgi:sigma-B regulation protein RsbU (phosphoserine phosphatase)